MTASADAPLADLLFAPRSVALIGASADPSKVSSRPLRYLKANAFGGTVFPVNPRGGAIEGVSVYESIDSLPERPDHAFVLLGSDGALEALEACVAREVPLVSILADGFGDAGPEGAERQRRLEALLRGSRTRLLGPNCMGLANPRLGLALTANASFADAPPRPGGFMLASQSGSMIGTLLSRGGARGIGFSRMIATGNEADLDAAEVCLACVADPEVSGFVLFLETIRSVATLSRLAHAAEKRGKPILAFKLGRSEVGRALAVTHTGALLADDDLSDACLRDLGIARVHHLETLFEATALFDGRRREAGGRRVGVMTTTGGGAAMVVDRLGLAGLTVAPASAESRTALASAGIAAPEAPILDLTLAGTRPDALDAALGVLSRDGGFDLLVVVLGSSAASEPERIVPPILAHAGGPMPVAAFFVPEAPAALSMCAEAGLPAFRTPEACADAVSAFLHRRAPRIGVRDVPRPRQGRTLDEGASVDRLAALGIEGPPRTVIDAGAPPAALPFAAPVVAKAALEGLAHKSDAGGVVLGIRTAAELGEAVSRIRRDVAQATGRTVERIQIVRQVEPLAELLLGYRVDPVFGPIVMVAPGGVAAELSGERSVRLAPVDRATAAEMLAELEVSRRLKGYRNVPAADVGAIADALAAISDPGDDVLEAEVNPLCASIEGAFALDGLLVVEDEA